VTAHAIDSNLILTIHIEDEMHRSLRLAHQTDRKNIDPSYGILENQLLRDNL
jgi:hypothetical protein